MNAADASVPPRATYRVQLTPQFGFDALRGALPYLARLGVSHVYLSPCLEALPGSPHGYDVTDPSRVRADFGGAAACSAAFADCRAHGLGILLDVVSNHMAASAVDNPWWRDLLRWGRASPYAHYFDVDWTRHEGRVLLPILGMSRAAALASGGVRLEHAAGELTLWVDDRALPVAARSLPLVLADLEPVGSPLASEIEALARATAKSPLERAEIEACERRVQELLSEWQLAERLSERLALLNSAPERLQAVIEAQHYRLRFWRAGLDELNYRRFFDVSDLAAVRVEEREVFDAVHVRIREWIESGEVAGLRVDHPDGLLDPEQYFERLRSLAGSGWIIAEKILQLGESLPQTWPVDGTTGYDFLNVAGRLFVDSSAEAALTATYLKLSELPAYDFSRSVHAAKARALRELLSAEVSALTSRALAACQPERGRAFNAGDVQRALVALITALPVYRTYARPGQPATEADRNAIEVARRHAVAEQPDVTPVVARLVELLCGDGATGRSDEFARAFQQLSGPAMAKGLEDTVFYDDARLLALNEVGGNPGQFGASAEDFHAHCRHIQALWPKTLLATSTHDTKRSEEVRLRISLLSELPGEWSVQSEAWMRRLRGLPGGARVDPRTLYFLLQTLVGVWPISPERLEAYLLKAVREAKAWTSWLSPDLSREAALSELTQAVCRDQGLGQELGAFVARLTPALERSSLALTLLKLTAPGVPDIYQGTELFDASLADPDNRRAVDYALREQLLSDVLAAESAEQLLGGPYGEAKLYLIARTLELRRRLPECFDARGAYTALAVIGEEQKRVVAFQRGARVITIAPRLTLSLPLGWRDTQVVLPEGRFRNVLTGDAVDGGGLEQLLRRFPVALLVEE